jgi:oligopeptide/dipeptide ABC transporter ATP-binding protein
LNKDLRIKIVKMITKAGEGHIPSSFSILDIVHFLYNNIIKYKSKNPKWEKRDYFVLSKGHGASGLYAVMFHHDLLSKDAIDLYFRDGSIMAGHASHFIDTVEHSTGALGHGLSVGLGVAIGSLSKNYKNRVFVVVGDGELHEGSNWEAIMYAGHLVEVAPVASAYEKPLHPYTQLLIESIPSIKTRKPMKVTEGLTHDLRNPPPGCIFQYRCPFVEPRCREQRPSLVEIEQDHLVACWLY